MKAREVKRARLCAKYAEKRKALKEAGDWAALDKLPKNVKLSRKPATGPLSTDSLKTRVPAVSTTVAPLPVVPKAICVFSVSAVYSSARWPARV